MKLENIKAKLESLQPKQKGEKKEKIDYSLYLWKPKEEGKYQIRIISSVYNKDYPFKEVFLHYGYSKFPIYALTNWNEKDPIVEFSKNLKNEEYDPEKWKLASKLTPKMRIFAPIIVRGEEDKGVRLWEFGKEVYQQLLTVAEDEDYGDYTDVNEGRDFTLTAKKGDIGGGRIGLKSTIQIKPKCTPLSEDPKEVEKWLSEQPDILDIQKTYKKTYEQLKEILAKFISPEEETEGEEVDEEKTDLTFKIDESKSKPKTSKKNFDDIFN